MPTYKNVSSKKRDLNGKVVEPGQTVYSTTYHGENEVELLKVDDMPSYNPILVSTLIEKDTEIEIPWRDNMGFPVTKYSVHFCVEKGPAIVRYNSTKNNPPLLLYPGAKWNIRVFERNIDSILIHQTEKSEAIKVYLIVEKL